MDKKTVICFCLFLTLSVLSLSWAKDIYLSGIMYDNKGKSTALINDEIVSEGDLIDGYRVKAIKTDMVILVKDGKELKLLANEPRNNNATKGAANSSKGLSCAGEVWYQKGVPQDESLGYKFIDDSTVELTQGDELLGRGPYTINKNEITIKHTCGTQRLVKTGNILKWVNGPAPIEFERVK